ncbi:hypothetical protein E2H98_01885 [Permianibacter aggregans]|uniref:hypothetical protein n=1 Tax=Permianibacter aggregans TaxID=1510150 RepID=UPI0012FAE41A|nr:hypothetical protein [Permianibacter aggregans]QGX38482.1 hypothetical protein E2H98_01885 [Permianibacter aggregans]
MGQFWVQINILISMPWFSRTQIDWVNKVYIAICTSFIGMHIWLAELYIEWHKAILGAMLLAAVLARFFIGMRVEKNEA